MRKKGENPLKIHVTMTAIMVALLAVTAGTASSMGQGGHGAKAEVKASPHGKEKSAYPLKLVDEAGHKVTITKLPYRIASTTEGTDEILSGLVPKQRIVMVTTFASQPVYSNISKYVKGIPAINQVNAEQVLAVKPGIVLMASYNTPAIIQQIEQTGVPVFEFTNFNSIQDIETNIGVVGHLVGAPAKAVQMVTAMKKQLQTIHRATAKFKKLNVLDYGTDGYTAGRNTTVDSVITAAGGSNAAKNINGWQLLTDEEIVKMNPQVIIDASHDTGFVKKIMSDPALASVAAVKSSRVYTINGAQLMAVSQYIVRGVRDVAHVLYPFAKLPSNNQLQ